jgi:hypothetical protein
MTRLTLDTIALCGFTYRFNSLYRDTPHPFVVAMLRTLEASQARAREPPSSVSCIANAIAVASIFAINFSEEKRGSGHRD